MQFIREAARTRLHKKIEDTHKPRWLAGTLLRSVLKIAVLGYVANGAFQTYGLLKSPTFEHHRTAIREAAQVGEYLAQDQTFHATVGAYIGARSLIDSEFNAHVDSLTGALQRAAEHQDAFEWRIRKIYDPFAER